MMGFFVTQLLLLCLVLGGGYAAMRYVLITNAQAAAQRQSSEVAKDLGASLRSVRTTALGMASILRADDLSDRQRDAILNSLVDADPEVAAGHVVLHSKAGVAAYSRYAHEFSRAVQPNPDSRPLIEEAYALGKPWWSEPYRIVANSNESEDDGYRIAYNLPIRSADRQVIGVVSLEVALSRLIEPVATILGDED